MYPRLFQIGPFTLFSFGLMVILGFLAGVALGARLCRERGMKGDALFDSAVVILIAGIAGARLLFVALHWREYSGHAFEIAATWKGGMSFHGGVGAGILTGMLCMKRRRLPALAMSDAAAPGLALGYAIGRIGCFLNGCCYGTPTAAPWGVHFPESGPGIHSHPTQIYGAAFNFALTAFLIWTYRRPYRIGQNLMLFITGYSVYRFLVEGLRSGVTAKVLALGLTEAQWFSLFAVLAGGAAWVWLGRHSAPAPPLVPVAPAEGKSGEE